MKQWTLKANTAKIEDLSFEDKNIPQPKAGQVRIKVQAVSLNARDLMVIEHGFMRNQAIDLIPASDMSGTIDEVGKDVTEWEVGDHVVNLHFKNWEDGLMPSTAGGGLGSLNEDGVLSEYIILDTERIARAPKGWSHKEACCLPCAGVTAWNALMESNPIVEGDTVLVIGTGGVATMASIIARGAGATVVAVVRHKNLDTGLKEMGVDMSVNSAEIESWGQEIFDKTGGVVRVVNTIGFSAVNNSLQACLYKGEVSLIGLRDQEGPGLDFNIFGKSIRGITVGSGKMYRDMRNHLEISGEKPIIAAEFSFSETKQGLNALKKNGTVGKIVITVA